MSFIFVIFIKYYKEDQKQDVLMGRNFIMPQGDENAYKILVGNLEGRRHMQTGEEY